ncbi:MAG: enoyl-CoA hydratase/isomerase family protein [Anaerolineae bacterium]|nr:enoyl-CoA hydratase/isomerase family protein [Anaerolineae bacterium]
MSASLLETRTPDHIITLTFHRPQALNALSLALMADFAGRVAAWAQDESVRAIILTGAGTQAFCSGGDLAELSAHPGAEAARHMITVMGDALRALERLPVPVIAAVNGYALGGGSEIALACDLRVVDEAVRFGLVQINMALTPGWGAGQRLLRHTGYSQALLLLLEGRTLGAQELLSLGLAQQVAAPGTAYAAALALAQQIAARPPDVVRGIKALLQAGLTQPYEQALLAERDLFPPLWAAGPHLEAVERFLSRRRPATPDEPAP